MIRLTDEEYRDISDDKLDNLIQTKTQVMIHALLFLYWKLHHTVGVPDLTHQGHHYPGEIWPNISSEAHPYSAVRICVDELVRLAYTTFRREKRISTPISCHAVHGVAGRKEHLFG
jgi:hypothetical protein